MANVSAGVIVKTGSKVRDIVGLYLNPPNGPLHLFISRDESVTHLLDEYTPFLTWCYSVRLVPSLSGAQMLTVK
jgi:hypothetical protein